MSTFFKLILGLSSLVLALLIITPSPIDAAKWSPAPLPDADIWQADPIDEHLVIRNDLLHGPEEITFDRHGMAYTGTLDGNIVRFDPDAPEQSLSIVANTGGRPLGLAFDKDNTLWIADGIRGLLRCQCTNETNEVIPSSQIEVIAGPDSKASVIFADDLAIDTDGIIWFTDASQRFNVTQWSYDILEMQATGRLLSYNPLTKQTRVHIEGMQFPNGVSLSPDKQSVLIAETTTASIRRYWIKGEQAGKQSTWISSLPGYPDNLHTDESGRIWLALASPRHSLLESLSNKPWLRNQIAKLPASLRVTPHTAWYIAFDEQGNILYNKRSDNTAFSHTASVTEHKGKLYLGNPVLTAMMITPVPQKPNNSDK